MLHVERGDRGCAGFPRACDDIGVREFLPALPGDGERRLHDGGIRQAQPPHAGDPRKDVEDPIAGQAVCRPEGPRDLEQDRGAGHQDDLSGRRLAEQRRGPLVLARVIQHEIDHLNGVLFVDRVSPVKKITLAGKLKRLRKEKEVELGLALWL